MNDVTQKHEEKETLSVDVILPGHDPRTTTPLFTKTKQALKDRDGDHCFICGRTSAEAGPLEAHHLYVERCLATAWDWGRFAADCKSGLWGPHAASFDWDKFDPNAPYEFVDNMLVNGVLICKEHHTGKDAGIHTMPFPLWLWQRYAPDGYQITPTQIIHHEG